MNAMILSESAVHLKGLDWALRFGAQTCFCGAFRSILNEGSKPNQVGAARGLPKRRIYA